MRILGIDPGSRCTGYGIIEDKPSLRLVAFGTIKPPKNMALPDRLKFIYDGLCEEIQRHGPEEAAIENVFFAANAKSALILGQARGVAVLAAANAGLHISEYPATTVKQSLVGFGRADKSQVSSMVHILLKMKNNSTSLDATDALALAICHSHTRRTLQKVFNS